MLRFGQQIVIERISTTVLLNEIDLSASLNSINKFGDDRVVQLGKDVDFPLQIFDLVRFIQPLLLVDLDSYFLVIPFGNTHLDHPICPLAQFLINLVVFELVLPLELQFAVEELLALHRLALLLLLHLLYLQFVYVIRSELLLHQRVQQLLVLNLGPLLLLLQRLLATLGVGHASCLLTTAHQLEVLVGVGKGRLARVAQIDHPRIFLLLLTFG
jgi:hypothetical protein